MGRPDQARCCLPGIYKKAQAQEGGWEVCVPQKNSRGDTQMGTSSPNSLEGARVVTGKERHRKHLGPLRTD